MSTQRAQDLLRGSLLKKTPARVAILKTLLSDHGPFSVDELRARPGARGLNRVTTYRTLTSLEEAGLVRRCEFGDNTSRYEYSGDGHHHHHVICKRCRSSEVVDTCLPESIARALGARGYTQISHSLEFFGVCPRCSASDRP